MFDLEHFWQVRKANGPSVRKYTVEELESQAFQYFHWIDTHPLQEMIAFHYRGGVVQHQLPKKRPYTFPGLAIFIGLSSVALSHYRNDEDYRELMQFIDTVIYTQKFEGAVAGLFNASVINRDLGLVERVETLAPPDHDAMTPDQLERELERRGIPKEIMDTIVGEINLSPDEYHDTTDDQ